MDTSWEHRIQICLWTFRLGILYTAIAPSQIVLANCLDYQRFNAIAHTMSRHRHTGFAIIMLDLKSTEHLKLATVYKIVRGYWSMPKRERERMTMPMCHACLSPSVKWQESKQFYSRACEYLKHWKWNFSNANGSGQGQCDSFSVDGAKTFIWKNAQLNQLYETAGVKRRFKRWCKSIDCNLMD